MEKAPPQLNLPSTKGKDIPMSTFNLGLPTDIPWERICFTTDMMHSPVCGGVRPSFGQSSIAVYSFTPDDEYQTLENYRISYVKVAVSLTPFDPNADANGGSPSTLITPYPCNGAVLQVSVGPSDPEGDARQIYFADAEPKKRELYEAVTDTGETVSGSQNRLSVGKSAMSSESTESGSRTGGSLRASIGIPIVVSSASRYTFRSPFANSPFTHCGLSFLSAGMSGSAPGPPAFACPRTSIPNGPATIGPASNPSPTAPVTFRNARRDGAPPPLPQQPGSEQHDPPCDVG